MAARILPFRLPGKPPAENDTQDRNSVDPWAAFADPIGAKRAHDEKYGGIIRRSREREAARRESELAQTPAADVSGEQKPVVHGAEHVSDPV
jgi:hypothetical protein